MLSNDVYVQGRCQVINKWKPDIYEEIAQSEKTIDLKKKMFIQTRLGLGKKKSEEFRALMKTQNVSMSYPEAEVNRIDKEVGNEPENDPICSSYKYYQKGKKEPEICKYSFNSVLDKICLETEKYLKSKGQIVNLDHHHPFEVNELKGGTILFGGDHGKNKFRFHAKIHLSFPKERKAKGELSTSCPMVQMCNLECKKDTYDLLQATVMPLIQQEIIQLLESALVIVHNTKQGVSGPQKGFIVPHDIDMFSITFNDSHFHYKVKGSNEERYGDRILSLAKIEAGMAPAALLLLCDVVLG